MSRTMRNVAGLVLAGLTTAGITWMFELTKERTMWENRYVLAAAGVAFLCGIARMAWIIRSFTLVGEKAARAEQRRERWRQRLARILNRMLRSVIDLD